MKKRRWSGKPKVEGKAGKETGRGESSSGDEESRTVKGEENTGAIAGGGVAALMIIYNYQG